MQLGNWTMYKQVIFHLEVPFVVAVDNEFGDVPRDDVAWTMCPWWVRSMWPFLYKQNTHQNQANMRYNLEKRFDVNTSSSIYHLLSLCLSGDDSNDIRPYKRPLVAFPLRLETTSSILTKASSSVFMIYLAGRILVCIFEINIIC